VQAVNRDKPVQPDAEARETTNLVLIFHRTVDAASTFSRWSRPCHGALTSCHASCRSLVCKAG